MRCIFMYDAPVGRLAVITDEDSVLSIVLPHESGKYTETRYRSPVIEEVTLWFDEYFAGKIPDFGLNIKPLGTEFQLSVWEEVLNIPYGQTITYGDIAKTIASDRGLIRMSAQAVGQAVGKNPIPILIPCHRVLGKGLKLTGYGGGIDLKKALLNIESIEYR